MRDMRTVRTLFKLAVVLDHFQRQDNYEEMHERLTGNIRRWGEQLDRNAEAIDRAESNLAKNESRVRKTVEYLDRLDSPATREWLERTERNAREHRNPEARLAASQKIKDHYAKVADARVTLERTHGWIKEGRSKLKNLESRKDELDSKISNASAKLRG